MFIGYISKKITQKKPSKSLYLTSLWCHQKTSFISKWLYIFALKNRNKRNLPLLLHLNSAPFCSVSQSRVPTLMKGSASREKNKINEFIFSSEAPPTFGEAKVVPFFEIQANALKFCSTAVRNP